MATNDGGSRLSWYVSFSGRARRSEFWMFFLVVNLAVLAAAIADAALGTGYLVLLCMLLLFPPFFAVGVRRLHDTGRSGWWMLLSFVPVLSLVPFVFWCLDSDPLENRYGQSPKTEDSERWEEEFEDEDDQELWR